MEQTGTVSLVEEADIEDLSDARIERKDGMLFMPLSDGTILDNYLILKVKEDKFSDNPEKLAAVWKELQGYRAVVDALVAKHPELQRLNEELQEIHFSLWYIEDRKREIERGEDVAAMVARLQLPENQAGLLEYLRLAREVSYFNDVRAQIKREMNRLTGSIIVEVKSHKTVG